MKPTFRISFAGLAFALMAAGGYAQESSNDLITNQAPLTNSLWYVQKLQPVTYEYRESKAKKFSLPEGRQFGFNAHDVKAILPWAVSPVTTVYPAGKNNYRVISIDKVESEKLIPLLVGALKELQEEVNQLKKQLTNGRSTASK